MIREISLMHKYITRRDIDRVRIISYSYEYRKRMHAISYQLSLEAGTVPYLPYLPGQTG